MKKTLLLIAFMACVSGIATAQKLLKPEVDKISGDTTWRTSEEYVYAKMTLGGANSTVSVQGVKIASSYILSVIVTSPEKDPYYALDNSKMYLKYADKSVVTLTAVKAGVTTRTGTNTSTFGSIGEGTKLLVYYGVTKEELKKLSTLTGLEVLRVESSKGNLDFEIKPKTADKLAKVSELIATK